MSGGAPFVLEAGDIAESLPEVLIARGDLRVINSFVTDGTSRNGTSHGDRMVHVSVAEEALSPRRFEVFKLFDEIEEAVNVFSISQVIFLGLYASGLLRSGLPF